jgi:CBS domain containing-hemolysin-like protein
VPRYLFVLLLARVAAEVSSTVLVTVVLLHWIGPGWRAFTVTAVGMTILIYMVAEIMPRAIGRRNPVRLASAASAVLHPVIRLLGPLPGLLLATGGLFSRASGPRDGPSGSEEDLRGLVDLLEQRRVIQPDERAMIHSVFELGDTYVREVMVPRTDMVFVEWTRHPAGAVARAAQPGFPGYRSSART